jgi:hypothetical protein
LSALEFYFSFFSLIMGIAVANVGIGFGKLWRAKEKVNVGLCLPLLGAWLLSHAILNWLFAWNALQAVSVTATTLVTGLLVALPYVVVSTVMFPEDADSHSSLDEFYLPHARLVMVAMMIPTSASMIGGLLSWQEYWAGELIERFVVVYLVPLVLIFWRNLWAHRIGLALALALMVWWLYR